MCIYLEKCILFTKSKERFEEICCEENQFINNNEKSKKEFLVFVILSIGGLLLNQFIMWIGTEIMTAYYLWVKAFALVFVPIYNFVTRKIFLEKKAP